MMFFGKSRTLPSQADLPLTLPGIISGYGGGTFDGQGHQVTPPQQTMARDDGRADPANPAVPAKIIQHILAQSGRCRVRNGTTFRHLTAGHGSRLRAEVCLVRKLSSPDFSITGSAMF
jgi:hypothetical protein